MSRNAPTVWAFAVVLVLVLGGCPKKKSERARRQSVAARGKAAVPAAKKGVAPQKKGTRKPASGGLVAEKQPHPDFPTLRLARTEKIFLLEEPDRGPWITKLAKVPPVPGGTLTLHSHCEVTAGGVACGRPGKGGVRAHWRVKRGGGLVLAERVFGPRVLRTYLLRKTKGALTQMVALDHHGQVRWSRHYGGGGTEYSSRARDGSNALTGCGFLKLEHDKKGEETVGCLQWTRQPMADEDGVVYTRRRRDRAGLDVESWRLDARKDPIDGQDGVHRTRIKRDAQGREVQVLYFDKEGFPTLSTRGGCYGWSYRHDGRGLLVRKACIGIGGSPAQDAEGVCAYTYAHNGRGCRTAVVQLRLGANKKCSRRHRRNVHAVNTACEIMTQVCYGATAKRKACGIREPAEYRYTRDALGRVTSRKHFAVDHKPGKNLQCASFEVRKQYDARGNVTRVTHHGPRGQAVNCSGAGYHGSTHVVDDAGRTRESRFLDLRGGAGTNLGCAVRRFHYDNYDHQVKTVNYGFDGKIKDVRGMGSMRIIYDQGHRQFGVLLYDVQGRPARYRACFTSKTCPRKKTWHAMRIKRRANGSVSKNLFFDHEGQLVGTVDCSKRPCWR